jgi:hypothetical protein
MVAAFVELLAKTPDEEGRDIVLMMLAVGLVILAVIGLGELFDWRARRRRSAAS